MAAAHIDLTLDDDDDNDIYRYAKRPRADPRQPPPPYRPLFAGPSPLRQQPSASHFPERQIIDLTGSPSPPPLSASSRHASQPPLPDDLPPKTPVCIGLLTVTALVLYPVPYIMPQNPGETEWVIVRLLYEHNPDKSHNKETIHIRTPSGFLPSGESISSKGFAVVEQRVADFLGPILGKGLIRLDAKIRKGTGNVRQLHVSSALKILMHHPSSFLSCPYKCLFTLPREISMLLEIIFTSRISFLVTQHHPTTCND